MEPEGNLIAPPRGADYTYAVAAAGVVCATVDELKGLRQSPGPSVREPLPAAFLKHADDQTVAGLAAVLQAIDRYGLSGEDFTEWGVVAAPRFLARATLAQALKRFAVEGAWGVSPHLIPHRSLHSVSGTVSQALHLHGPNFGVGGGPHGAAKAMIAAAAMLADARLPGLWVVLTGWNREPGVERPPAPSTNGHAAAAPICSAVALALQRAQPDWNGPSLQVAAGNVVDNGHVESVPVSSFTLEAFIDSLSRAAGVATWRLDCGGWVRLAPPIPHHSPLTTHRSLLTTFPSGARRP